MNHRATIALALATLGCFAVLSFNNGENFAAKESINTSESFDESSLVQVAGPGDESVMSAIVDLKAYCMGARKKAIKMKNGGKTSSLVPFIIGFGKRETHKDLVTAYAQEVGKLRARYTTGLGSYLLDRMNEHVLTGKKVTLLGTSGQLRNRQMLDFKRLGLQTMPLYFKTLNVRLTSWSSAKAAIHRGKGGAAIKAWVKSGNAEIFKLFLAKITARYERQRQIQDAKEEDGALIAERAAFKQGIKNKRGVQQVMEPMPPAGAKGGRLVRTESKWKMPSPKEIKKEAMDKTIHYMATLAKRDASSAAVVKAIEAKLEGTTIRMTTSAHMFAESIMAPEVELDGTLGTLYGKISGVPLVGQTLEQTFTGKNIGDITHVTLRAPKKVSDPWLCSKFEVQVGTGNPWIVMTRSGFAGAYKFWLDNKPYNSGPYYGLQRRDFWVLRAVGTAKPAFHKKFANKWPHCHNISCMYGDLAKFERGCAKNPRCNGFSFSAGKKSHGNGCLKMKCGKNQWSERGFGRKTHDYYMKYSSYWAKVVKKRENAAKAKVKKELSKKEKSKKEKSKKMEMKHKEREQKAREAAAKAAARKERAGKAAARAKEIEDKERSSKRKVAQEKHAKAQERNSKESSAKYERSSKESAYKARFLPRGSCCWFLYGCSKCCDKCSNGNHWVGPGTCGTSRKCN